MENQIISLITNKSLPSGYQSVCIKINYFTKENSFEIDREYSKDIQTEKIIDREFSIDFLIDLDDIIRVYHQNTSTNSNRWNKVQFVVYKDGQYEVNKWWDAEFQKSLYGTED